MFIRSLLLCCLCLPALAVAQPAQWPPLWAGDANGGAEGVNADDHTGFDYGLDAYGYWAHLEIEDGSGNVLMTVEMRYINPVEFTIGSPSNEQGHCAVELQARVTANSGRPYWIAANECTQELWEIIQLKDDAGFSMKLKQRSNADIADLDTAAFPIDVQALDDDTYLNHSGYPNDIKDGLVHAGNWQAAAAAAFTAAYNKDKHIRAVESQTFEHCKVFCDTQLKNAIFAATGQSVTVRLPTEAEWEFACRAETETAYWTGRELSGLEVSHSSGAVTKSGFWADFDKADIAAKTPNFPRGDKHLGGDHPEWHSNKSKHLKFVSIDGDGVGHVFWHDWYGAIAGTLTVNGGSIYADDVVANYDERYQYHYVADVYGTHTPILMIYELLGTEYIPRVHGDPTAPNMYYKLKDVEDGYLKTSDLNASNTVICSYNGMLRERELPPATDIGDWYVENGVGEPQQLEFYEMVQVFARYDAAGNDDENGAYIKDAAGVLHPIRTRYVPAPFRSDANYIGSTFPDVTTAGISIEQAAREANLSDDPNEEMSTEDYIDEIKREVAKQLLGSRKLTPYFYTGSQSPSLIQMPSGLSDIHFIDNINVVVATEPTNDTYVSFDKQVRNPWGLYNMHGNVTEWTLTEWDGRSNHTNHVNGPYRVGKGGSWKCGAHNCRSATRIPLRPERAYEDVGFRFIIED